MPEKEMSPEEIDQFLMCARVGRLGLALKEGPYVVPVGFAYAEGKVFFHTCSKGSKMKALAENPIVCFEADESLSDSSMYKSVIVFGKARIVRDKDEMVPYLQKLIDKYRIHEAFDEYMSKPGRNREKEMAAVRICVITPTKVTGKKFIAKSDFHAPV
jgi:nitroimidazol reductase NimA-like FMN-containing flavoprotein (pyridoxamine 5'-phosphate oxidase superfamily)